MKKRAWFGLAVGWFLLVFVSIAGAGDTSPYLIGVWEDNNDGLLCESNTTNTTTISTDFIVVNPTTVQLDVYAAFFENDGTFTGVCYKNSLKPNAKWFIPGWRLGLYYNGYGYMGTAKFIALPTGAKRIVIDGNAVIGGFQNRWFCGGYCDPSMSQADLKGVTINLYTSGEVTKIVNLKCEIWTENVGR